MSGWGYLIKDDVVTIQNRKGDYITACEDKRTVVLKKELHLQAGSNNPHYWTLVDTGYGIQTIYVYHLKSIYGTFLTVDTEGACKKLCQKLIPVGGNFKRGYDPWVLNYSTCYSMAPPNRFYLQYTHGTAVHIEDDGSLVLGAVSELKKGELWHIQVVDTNEKATLQNYEEEQNNQAWEPTPLNATPDLLLPPAHTTVTVPSHSSQLPIDTHHEYSLKSEKNKVEVNFYSQMGFNSGPGTVGDGGGAGPSSVCSTGRNINISGTQETGDVDIRYQVGNYKNLSFKFDLA